VCEIQHKVYKRKFTLKINNNQIVGKKRVIDASPAQVRSLTLPYVQELNAINLATSSTAQRISTYLRNP